MIDVADGNTVYYYHFDGVGSVIALSNVNGEIVERYSYDVFGEPNRTSNVNNPYFFTGRRYDKETALYYYRARYYDCYIGRFLQTDPIGYDDGMNMYAYCGNNPGRQVDPYGLCKGDLDYGNLTFWDWFRELHIAGLKGLGEGALNILLSGYRTGQAGMGYYEIFKNVGYNRAESAGLAANMTGGKLLGYSTLLEGLMGINVAEMRLISGQERITTTAIGGVQTAISTVVLAEVIHKVTTTPEPTIRPGVTLSGGRGGQNVKNLTGPPNSVVKGNQGRIFVTNEQGQVIKDITSNRVKPVVPGSGFGPKRAPTKGELDLIQKLFGG